MKSINTYLTFDGNCREAMNFYGRCFGAQVQFVTFAEAPGNFPPEAKSRIMHSRLGQPPVLLMASDSMPGMPYQQGNDVWISIDCEGIAEIEKLFNAFSENAKKIVMPLGQTFWATRFGMLTDQFGVNWMFNFEEPKQA